MLESDAIPSAPAVPGTATPNIDELLGDFARQHPDMAWMTQWIAQSRNAPQPDPQPDPRDEAFDAMRLELDRTREHASKLARLARRLADDLDTARERLAELAASAGACGLCWGSDPRCPACRGRGAPGHFAPGHLQAAPHPET